MMEISIKAEEIFEIGSFVVTNSLFLSVVVFLILALIAIRFKKSIKAVPGTFQNILEFLMEALLNLMDSILGNRKKSEKYLPLVATIFVFIVSCNWLGLLPGVGSFVLKHGEKGIPLLRSPASDLNFTLTLAVISVVLTNIFGIAALGIGKHLKKFFNFSNPIKLFVGLLELVSEVARMVSFSFRLFGNIFAGEVLLIIVFFLVPYVVPVPFLFMEFFFGMIQAFIFSILTLVFLAMHTAKEEH